MITGKKEVRNATEVGLNANELELLSRYISGRKSGTIPDLGSKAEIDSVVESVLSSVARYAKRLSALIKLDCLREGLSELGDEEKIEMVLRILALANAATNASDLSLAGGPKSAGCMKLTYSKILTDAKTDFYIIDQSVTGMFERRTRVGL